MTSQSHFYETSLYPLQDGVLKAISQNDTDFFLTGGTALSRAYFNHRYSDDLDFFVNNSNNFNEQLDSILDILKREKYNWDLNTFLRSDNYCRLFIYKEEDIKLKLDFVNDTVPHYGDIISTNLFYRTDSIKNILSNKLSAIYRYEVKDIVDIREIALNKSVNWVHAIEEARTKEASIDLPIIAEIILGTPRDKFDSIAWVNKPEWKVFNNELKQIVSEMLTGNNLQMDISTKRVSNSSNKGHSHNR